MKDIGVDDVLDVKIYDSRLNGQSKGFCLVTFGSEASISQVFEKGTLIRIHDKVPVFKADTKQNVAYVSI
jgi:cleavage and polyadenylation specificity factor subunit 6/7